MAHPPKKPASPPRGTTILEAMIALSILLIGLLGMAQLQLWGLSSNQGARARTHALEVARELAAALERLPVDDPRVAANLGGSTLPANFGKVMQVDGSLDPSDFTAWDDGLAANLPNVRPDTSFERDREDPSLPAFQRRWSVWAPTGLAAQYVKLIGVSVVYREQTFARPMEVTLLVQVGNTGAILANAAAYR